MATPYAQASSGASAREEITKILRRFGCESIGFMDEFDRYEVLLAFTHRGRQVQLRASAKGWAQMYLKENPWNARRRGNRTAHEQAALRQGLVAVNSILRDWIKGRSPPSSAVFSRLKTCSCPTCSPPTDVRSSSAWPKPICCRRRPNPKSSTSRKSADARHAAVQVPVLIRVGAAKQTQEEDGGDQQVDRRDPQPLIPGSLIIPEVTWPRR